MPATSRPPRHLALILALLAMLGPFSIDTMFPAFKVMAADLGASKAAVQQTLSVYLFAYALMSLVHGPLSDALGRRRVILTGLVVFVLASAGCALADSLPVLLAFRALQGLSAGVGLIVGRAVIRDVYEGADVQRLMSQVSVIFGLAPAIAPIVGGWLLQFATWPAIFYFLAVFAALVWLAVLVGLPETHPLAARSSLRPAAIARTYWQIASHRRFLRLALAAGLNFSALFLYIASAPALMFQHLGRGEGEFGWLFIPMISGMMLGAWASGRLAGRMESSVQVRGGFACCLLAAAFSLVYHGWSDAPALGFTVLPIALNAFGIALVFPVLTVAILDMFPLTRGAASSMQAFISLVMNGIVAGVVSPGLSHDLAWLSAAAAALSLSAWLLWRGQFRQDAATPSA